MLHPDFKDLLLALGAERVEYLVIGGYAVSFHAKPRFTKDIELWVRDDSENLARLAAALETFGAPATVLNSLRSGAADEIAWFGIPPTRVDILRSVSGGDFGAAYASRVDADWDGVPVSIVGLDTLIALKRAAGREQDLRDVRALERRKTP